MQDDTKKDAAQDNAPSRGNVRHRLLALITSVGMGISGTAQAADLRLKFDQVSIGLTQEAVVSLMGVPPTSTQEASTLGISTSRLRWDESVLGPVYQVAFVWGRVVEKRVCDRRNEC